MILMIKPRGGILFRQIYIRVHMFDYEYDEDFRLTVMLRSTTGPYGRPVIELTYGETLIHSTEAV